MNITRQYPWKQLVILFVVSLLLYSIIAWNFGNYRVFYDEVAHNNYAKAIAAGDFFEFRGEPIWYFEVLYSMIISPVFMLFDDTVFAHYAIMFLNSVMMSSAVFPIYLIASRLLEDKKLVWLAVIYGVLIPERLYSLSVIQENLNYPLMMWFFCLFVYIICSSQNNVCFPISLSCISLLLTAVKQMNLAVVLAVFFYYLYCVVMYKEERRRYIRDILCYSILYFGLQKVYTSVICSFVDTQPTGRSLFDFLDMLNSVQDILILGYAFTVYIICTLLATGIFQIPILASSISKADRKTRDLTVFLFIYIIIYIGTICLKIVLFEDNAQASIRIHLRYYFYGFILLFILFLSWYEKQKVQIPKGIKSATIYSLLFISAVFSFIDVIPKEFNSIDNISLNYLALFQGHELLQPVLKICIVTVIFVGIIFLQNCRQKAIFIFTIFYIAVSSLLGISIYLKSSHEYSHNTFVQQQTSDAILLNSYWKSEGLPTDDGALLCIVGNKDEVISEAVFECYLLPQYHYVQENVLLEQWYDTGHIDFSTISYLTLNAYETNENLSSPEFLIMRKESGLILSGYELIPLELEQYSLYRKVSDDINIMEFINVEGVSGDKWVSRDASISYAGNQDSAIATFTLELDNILFSHDVVVYYRDGKGNTGTINIPNNGSSILVDIGVEKGDSNHYQLILHTDDAVQPSAEDTRFLSFQLLDVNIKESNDGA